MKAGRGFGKTRTGAEWTREQAEQFPGIRIALVARTAADTRDVMLDGPAGLLNISPPWFLPKHEPSKRRLVWPNGSVATLYSADEPNLLRGPQHHRAWADELASWKYSEAWDMLMFGLRLDRDQRGRPTGAPRAVITTTPRPIPIVKKLLKKSTTVVTGGSTYDNRENLAPEFFEEIIDEYAGTRMGRQEIDADVLEDVEGALWSIELIEKTRLKVAPEGVRLVRVVIAIDPAVTNTKVSDETGITVEALGSDGHGYTLADLSGKYSPGGWATRALNAVDDFSADCIVGEVNNGGDLVQHTVRMQCVADKRQMPRFVEVHASRGKAVRAEPFVGLYEQGRYHHVGAHPKLEDQMCSWVPGESSKSPDRLDAHVWGAAALFPNRGQAQGFVKRPEGW